MITIRNLDTVDLVSLYTKSEKECGFYPADNKSKKPSTNAIAEKLFCSMKEWDRSQSGEPKTLQFGVELELMCSALFMLKWTNALHQKG
jgi:hypothetical protein